MESLEYCIGNKNIKDLEKKRYLIFGYQSFYPSGGLQDILFSFNTKEDFDYEIKQLEKKLDICDKDFLQYCQIFDTETFKSINGHFYVNYKNGKIYLDKNDNFIEIFNDFINKKEGKIYKR